MSPEKVRSAIEEHPKAKAVIVNNPPTYYGICSDLRKIVSLAKAKGLTVLVDEAHGAHLYFGSGLPVTAMSAGAEMAAVSMHKSGGSLTQSSLLLCSDAVNAHYVRKIINLTQTTSSSYLLLASLDISRRNLALRGREIVEKVQRLADYARGGEINGLGGAIMPSPRNLLTATASTILTPPSCQLILLGWGGLWGGLRSMIYCAMNMGFKLSSVIWPTSLFTSRWGGSEQKFGTPNQRFGRN